MRVFGISSGVVNGGSTVTVRHKADGNVETIGFSGIPTYAEGQLVTLGATRLIKQGDVWALTLPAFTSTFIAQLRVEYGTRTWKSAPFSIAIDADDEIAVRDAFTAENFKAVTDELSAARGESETLGDRLDAADEADEALGERIAAVEIPGIVAVAESRTLALTDAGKMLKVTADPSAVTLTIPANETAAFPVGTRIEIMSYSDHDVTVASVEGVGLYSNQSYKNIGPDCVATLIKMQTDDWILSGTLKAAE